MLGVDGQARSVRHDACSSTGCYRRRLPIYPGQRDLDWYVAGLVAKEGWKGRRIAPATTAAPACSTINSVRAQRSADDAQTE
jgi:hypothetical protein